MALEATIELTASSVMTTALDLGDSVDSVATGVGEFPECLIELEDGNGNEQAQAHWHDLRTVAAGVWDSIDLSGALTGPLGATVNVVKVKTVLVVIQDPGPTKRLQLGPQGQTAAALFGFGYNDTPIYFTCTRFAIIEDVDAGYAIVNGATDRFIVHNPTAGDITYAIWISYTTS
jgi:hypothetical protein